MSARLFLCCLGAKYRSKPQTALYKNVTATRRQRTDLRKKKAGVTHNAQDQPGKGQGTNAQPYINELVLCVATTSSRDIVFHDYSPTRESFCC